MICLGRTKGPIAGWTECFLTEPKPSKLAPVLNQGSVLDSLLLVNVFKIQFEKKKKKKRDKAHL